MNLYPTDRQLRRISRLMVQGRPFYLIGAQGALRFSPRENRLYISNPPPGVLAALDADAGELAAKLEALASQPQESEAELPW